MIDQEQREARRSFDSWAALTVEMIDDGSLPGHGEARATLRAMLTGPERRVAWMIFLAGFMSVDVEEDEV